MEKSSLFIMTHKELKDPTFFKGRKILLVGSCSKSFKLDYNDDDFVDNISNKNLSYCELTGLFYIWKNTQSEFVGLEHYRRVFAHKNRIIPLKDLENKMKSLDIIIPYPYMYKICLREQYKNNHYINDLIEVESIIREIYPEYEEAFEYIMNSKYCSLYNMFFSKKYVIDEYCQFLFDILFQLENRININERNDYQKRVYGFLSERLFNVWLYHNVDRFKIGYENVLFLNGKTSIYNLMKDLFKKFFNRERIVKRKVFR